MRNSLKKMLAMVSAAAIAAAGIFPAANVGAEDRTDQNTAQEETSQEETSQFMDCFLPMPIIEPLSADCWGAPDVGKRDPGNGLEDRDLSDYCYWDGGIIKDDATGKYYMFASRWNQAGGHWGQDGISGWQGSQAVYAVSDNLYGPYEDQGPIWPDWCEGAGHNVFPFEISENDALYSQGYRYAISISDTGMHGDIANGTIHIAKSVKGPWELIDNGNAGKLKAQGGNGFSLSNISILVRPDGKYEATNRNGDIAIADSLSGTWDVKENGLWWKVPGMPTENIEDPIIWYSDGLYHCVANKWDARRAYYMTSEDGINDWKLHHGTAYSPDDEFLYYEDGTVNNWRKIERPNIYVEDGKIAAMTLAVIDVEKEQDFGNDRHGSKVIVVPFDSEKLKEFTKQSDPIHSRKGEIPVADTSSQSWQGEANMNYGARNYIRVQRNNEAPEYGLFGEKIIGGSETDCKVGYLKFDISDYKISEIKNADLSFVYTNHFRGDAKTDSIQVALADTNWLEGSGNEGNNFWADSGVLTWNNQPKIRYDSNDADHTTATSATFRTSDTNTIVTINVTNLLQSLEEGTKTVSLAVCETAGNQQIGLASKEAGKGFEPRLTIKKEEEKPKVSDIFEDIGESDWFVDYVQYVFDKQIMTGLDDTHFGPAAILSRAQFAAILYRMEGEPEVKYEEIFPDVPDKTFYTEAVIWASSKGIITGYEDRTFGPADMITREQMALMMYRYAEYKKFDVKARAELQFGDAASVSPFARTAMEWAVAKELISGNLDGTLAPQGEASRGVCAAIIKRFMEQK